MSAGHPPVAMPTARPRCGRLRKRGFTLAELSVVVVIVGLLTMSMFPNYMRHVYRARRTESLDALRAIHDFERVHYAEHDEYSDSLPTLGFVMDGGKQLGDGDYQGPYYTYTLSTWELGGKANANYRAMATGDLDHDGATLDIVIIENALTVLD